MKRRFFSLFIIIIVVLCFCWPATSQPPFFFGPPNPFLFPLNYFSMFPLNYFSMFPPLRPFGPYGLTGLMPRTSLPLLSAPKPMLRYARATVTIFFNPALSVIQVTVLPVTSPAATVAPIVTPTSVAPAIAPSALFLLPLLSSLGTTTPNINLNTVGSLPPATPVSTTPTGLSALLPII